MHVAIERDAYHTNCQNNFPITSVTAAILATDEGNQGTFPILDALACISVSQCTSQVVAIGFQWTQYESKISLTIVENANVQKGLVPFLSKICSYYEHYQTYLGIPEDIIINHNT